MDGPSHHNLVHDPLLDTLSSHEVGFTSECTSAVNSAHSERI